MVSRALRVSTLVVLTLSSIACGGDPPDKEIQQAQAAIDAARAAGAEQYAADEFVAAATALRNATTAVEQHDYRLALNHALDGRERGQNAAKQAGDARASARAKADNALASAAAALAAAGRRLKAGEAARVPAHVLADARASLRETESRVQEARTALERGDYVKAASEASTAEDGLKAGTEGLAAALAPVARRRH